MATNKSVRSILIAVDLSEGSGDAIRAAAEIAVAAAAPLHVVHAHDEPRGSGSNLLVSQRGIHEKRMQLQDLLGEVLPATVQLGVVRVTVGSPAEVILQAALSLDVDLIVLGAHRQRKFADRVIGSTMELVLRRATVPCLMLNRPLALPISRALVPSDLSGTSARAVDAALTWLGVCGKEGQSRVTLANVIDSAVEGERSDWREQEVTDALLESVPGAGEKLDTTIPVDVVALRGEDVAGELIRHAETSGADLIVMGTRGDGVIIRALLGSVSSAIFRRSQVPVMLVPRSIGALPEIPQPASEARALEVEPFRF